jgi:alcohol dehydrogenase class IV
MPPNDPTMLGAKDWGFPVPIAHGPGRLAEIGQRCVKMGSSDPLVVTDRGSHDLPFIAQLQSSLLEAGLKTALHSDISPSPVDGEIGAGRADFLAGGHDAIIATGGGSAMDGGKAICLTARHGRCPRDVPRRGRCGALSESGSRTGRTAEVGYIYTSSAT